MTSWSSWIGEQLGATVGVAELRRITTGHSRGNWFLELDDGSRFVVRVEQGGVFGTSGADEFEFMQAVGRLGFPVARVRWLEPTGDVIGQPFFVMDFIEGGVATEREDRSLAPELAVDFVRRLDELHQLEWEGVLDGPPPSEATHVQIERWADVYRSSSPLPVPLLEEGGGVAARTTRRRSSASPSSTAIPVPATSSTTAAGCWRSPTGSSPTSAIPTEDWSFLALDAWGEDDAGRGLAGAGAARGGRRGDETQLRYWRAFNFFKGACANRSCLKSFAGANPAPNMALIGTVLQQTFMRQLADLVGQRSGSSTPESRSSSRGS